MALHPAEEATLRAFVTAAKRDRLLTLFGSPKRRRRARGMLDHFAAWDARFAQPVDSSADVLALLRKADAPPECRVMSASPDLDGRDMTLGEAVAACETEPHGSVLCCVPGQLAFFFAEAMAPRPRVLLRRPGADKLRISVQSRSIRGRDNQRDRCTFE